MERTEEACSFGNLVSELGGRSERSHSADHLSCDGQRYRNIDGGDNQNWRFERDYDIAKRSFKVNWMGNVPSDTKLSMLNLVATHESISLQPLPGNWLGGKLFDTFDLPVCQTRSPYEQLQLGVRILDLRFDVWKGEKHGESVLYARHGISKQGYTACAVLHSVRLFLNENPSETVIVTVRNEKHTEGCLRAFMVDASRFEDDLF